ncbi:hypothetical protein VP1G_11090 [Cytospora mali]|uniref:Uncharacterized protein n=1 Tax=Cytospora mali TaxID=578113 RepID=A0A194V6C5_CYTMA|nr:hypothetical protein VP1G_11090 [Valsa mali var. pyri (nom. inval.)]
MSSTLDSLVAPLNGLSNKHHAPDAVRGAYTPGRDAMLIGVGAQFDAHSTGLSGERHAHNANEK